MKTPLYGPYFLNFGTEWQLGNNGLNEASVRKRAWPAHKDSYKKRKVAKWIE